MTDQEKQLLIALQHRKLWLDTAASIFKMIYKDDANKASAATVSGAQRQASSILV